MQCGIALSALSFTAVSAMASDPPTSAEPLRFERFVFDGRFAEAAFVARRVAVGALRAARIDGDLTALWYDDLDLAWKHRPMTIAGVTTWHGLFVLETLAADRGMRVVYRGRHDAPVNGRARHTLTGPAAMIGDGHALTGQAAIIPDTAAPGRLFWAALGHAMAHCPASRITGAVEVTTREEPGARAEPLYSWIIAPRSPALNAV
jgi:hypothetical protein